MQLKETPERNVVRGIVVDVDGNPLKDARVRIVDAPGVETKYVPGQGEFECGVHGSGTFNIEVSVGVMLDSCFTVVGCEVLEGSSVTVVEGQSSTLRIVATPKPYLKGCVVDETGQPLEAAIEVLCHNESPEVCHDKSGQFLISRQPDKPFLIEFRKEGYIPHILESRRDFQPDDHTMQVTLRKGPLSNEESIFKVVTGRSPEKAKSDGMPFLDEIQRREVQYKKLASQEHQMLESKAASATDSGYTYLPVQDENKEERNNSNPLIYERQLLIYGLDGKPAQKLYVQSAYDLSYGEFSGFLPSTLKNHSQVVESSDGYYKILTGNYIWTPGAGRVLIRPDQPPAPDTITITLQPAGKIIVKVVDEKNKPIEGSVLGLPETNYRYYVLLNQQLNKATSNGILVVDDLAPGTYTYRILKPKYLPGHSRPEGAEYPLWSVFQVASGEVCEETVVFDSESQNTAIEILAKIREHRKLPSESELQAIKGTNAEDVLGTLVSDYINMLSKTKDWETCPVCGGYADCTNIHAGTMHFISKEISFITKVIKALKLDSAIPALKAFAASWEIPDDEKVLWSCPPWSPMEAIADVGGDNATDFFAELAADDTRPYRVRRDAVIALGRIGSENSVVAYKKLCEKVSAYPETSVSNSTPEQKMYASFVKTFFLIPGNPEMQDVFPESKKITLKEDGLSGEILFQEGSSSSATFTTITLRCIGGDWFVIGMEVVRLMS